MSKYLVEVTEVGGGGCLFLLFLPAILMLLLVLLAAPFCTVEGTFAAIITIVCLVYSIRHACNERWGWAGLLGIFTLISGVQGCQISCAVCEPKHAGHLARVTYWEDIEGLQDIFSGEKKMFPHEREWQRKYGKLNKNLSRTDSRANQTTYITIPPCHKFSTVCPHCNEKYCIETDDLKNKETEKVIYSCTKCQNTFSSDYVLVHCVAK